MKNYLQFILYKVLFIYMIKKCTCTESLINIKPSLKVYFNRFIIEEYEISFLNNSYNDYKLFSHTGKIIYLKNYSELKKLDIYNNYFNHNWIFFLNSTKEIIKFIEDLEKKISNYSNSPLIIPQSLNVSKKIIFQKSYVFEISDEIFNEIIRKYNFEKLENNFFFKIEFSFSKLEVPYEYLKNVTLFCFAISTLLLMFWKHKFKKNTMNEFIFVCRCSIFFPMIKLVICLFILVKIKQESESTYLIGYKKNSIIDFIIMFINLIYKSFMLFFSILVSEGVDLTNNFHQLSEIRTCIKKHTFIYLLLCFDDIIDIIIMKISGNITLIESKNILVNFFILIILLYKGRITYRILKRRLFFAFSNFEEFIPSLKLKIKIISSFMKIHVIHFFLFCFFSMIINNVYPIQIFKQVHNNITDIFLAVSYTIIFFPRKWPRFFLENLKDDMIQFSNVFKVNFNNLKFNKFIVDKSYPVVIVNPNYFFNKKKKRKKIDNVIFNIKFGVIENENKVNDNDKKKTNNFSNEGMIYNI